MGAEAFEPLDDASKPEQEHDAAFEAAMIEARALGACRASELQRELDRICEVAGYTMADVRGRNRQSHLVELRRIVVRFLRAKGFLSLPEIGEMVNRDHTTVKYLLDTRSPFEKRSTAA